MQKSKQDAAGFLLPGCTYSNEGPNALTVLAVFLEQVPNAFPLQAPYHAHTHSQVHRKEAACGIALSQEIEMACAQWCLYGHLNWKVGKAYPDSTWDK